MSQSIHRLYGAPRLVQEEPKTKYRVSIVEKGCVVECFEAKTIEEANRKVAKLFVEYQEKGYDIGETEYYIEEAK